MVGKNIKRFREEKKITQEELAEKMCVTRQAISNWECEKTSPDIETLHKIAEIFEISIEELIYGERQKKYQIIFNKHNAQQTVNNSVILGTALAAVISYVKWQSIGWAIFHGMMNWVYVIYYIIKYGWN